MLYIWKKRRNFSLVACYSLTFTRCSLLFAKFACYSLLKLLVTKNHSLLVAKFTPYSLQMLLVAKHHSLLVAKFAFLLVTRCKKSQVHKVRQKFFQYNLFPRAKKFNVVTDQHIKLKSVVSRTFSNATVYKWVKTPQLLALSQRNE